MAVFFFSSRRRHTRWPRDWSSDVCSSDLVCRVQQGVVAKHQSGVEKTSGPKPWMKYFLWTYNACCRLFTDIFYTVVRSEERRVGKECGWWWWGRKQHRAIDGGRGVRGCTG